jgi:aspartyl-tRNA(Asn)/glutamyl-tRNA(Gln) amidotransferase subunit B
METRVYDEKAKTTKLMRTKDNAMDYRFISDPDLPVLEVSNELIEKIKLALPETPQEKLKKLIKEYKIEEKYAEVLTKKISLVEIFEKTIKKIKPSLAIPWVTIELLSVANYNKVDIDEMDINSEHFIELLEAIQNKKIIELKAKDILRKWISSSTSPTKEIIESATISFEEVEKFAKEVISESQKAVEDYKNGNKSVVNFMIGQVMKKSNKRADFKFAKEVLERLLL